MEIASNTSSQASACCADRLALHSKVLEVEDHWLQQSKFEDDMFFAIFQPKRSCSELRTATGDRKRIRRIECSTLY